MKVKEHKIVNIIKDATIIIPESYPKQIDCLVLPSTILLPRSHVPINISESWAVELVDRALQADRYIGVVQPKSQFANDSQLFSSGTLGRLTTFVERGYRQYFITLTGLCRFDVDEQLECSQGFCRLSVNYHRFSFDSFEEKVSSADRQKLITLLRHYLSSHQVHASLDEFEHASDEDLMTGLTMLCPFQPEEKQALLESPTAQNRYTMMTAFMESALWREVNQSQAKH